MNSLKPFLVAFSDLLLASLVVFVVLTGFLLSHISADKSTGNVIDKSDFIIEATWEDGSNNDVDLLVRGPTGDIVFFSRKDNGVMSLDRDDMGHNNTTVDAFGKLITNSVRREVISIRKAVEGQYTVNLLMYKLRDEPSNVHVLVRKLNPYSEVGEKNVKLDFELQESTAFTFNIGRNSTVKSVDQNPQLTSFAEEVAKARQ